MIIAKKVNRVLFHHVVNLTHHHVGFYDVNGNVVSFHPGYSAERIYELDPDTMVIVESEADKVAYAIPDENAVYVKSWGIGYMGARVSRLARFKDGADAIYDAPNNRFCEVI